MNILVTGGAGYIGSHAVVELINSGYNPIIIDNFINSSEDVIDKLKKIVKDDICYYNLDARYKDDIVKIIKEHSIEYVMHFAGLKSVNESINNPLKYYDNNINSLISVLEAMNETNVNNIIFSSSATVYGENNNVPYKEDMVITKSTNPYGNTKIINEEILKNICDINKDFTAISLRYFNPIGAHKSGLIGDNPVGIPNNLLPYIMKVAIGELDKLTIFGNKYPTKDGTCERDYIHITDLVNGHIKAIDYSKKIKGFDSINLGTGKSYSVLEILSVFEKVSGIQIPYVIGDNRKGDLPIMVSDITKAKKILKWEAKYDIYDMCLDYWNYIRKGVS